MTITAIPDSATLPFLDSVVRVRVSCDDGNGATSVLELTAPRGSMPPLHAHAEDETYYVLEGAVTFYKGDATVRLSAGDSLLAPRDVPHTFVAESDTLRMLVVSGGSFERLVRASAGRPFSRADRAALATLAAEQEIVILGPPGTLPSDLA
jgi:quercetin dioxygenase-like cupin family protein